jgi:diguanylate cyclase (GGDEF)-like protein
MRARCDEEVTRALLTERRGGGLAFFFWDFYRFRWYNNQGRDHQLGDTVLRCHGDILRTCIRQDSHVFRFGGDEFLAIAPDEDSLEAALVVASRIDDAVRTYPWIGTDHRLGEHLPRVNMGVLHIPIPAEVERLAMRDAPGLVERLRHDLYRILDLLMYGAKADMERGEARVHSRIGHIANGLILDEQARDLRLQLEQQIDQERSDS